MTGIMMAQAGVGAAAGADTTGLLLLGTSITGLAFLGSGFQPLASFRAKTDGVAQKATGSTQSPLSYVNLPNDQYHTGHPITGADYEIFFNSLSISPTGDAGTWFGDQRDNFLPLSGQRTWTWQKDTSGFGTATHQIIITIRNIATPAQLTQAFITFNATIET